jgi:hypothetical protein
MGFAGILRQSTAVDVLIGPFVDSADGDTEETALTISQGDVLLSKNGQPAAQKNDATACAHDADGFYNCELDATDTNTVGQLTLYVHEAGALAVRHDFQVIEEAVYDILYAASATGAVPVASIAANAITATAMASDAITAAKLAADVTTELQSGLATSAALATVDGIVDDILADTNELQTDWVNGGRLDLILDIIAADTTTDIPGTIATLQTSVNTIDDFLDTEVAAILAAVDTEVASILAAVDTEIASVLTAVDTEVAAILALLDDARGEPAQGAPPVNPDMATKVDYLYKAWRNKTTQTATEYSLFADDAATVDHKASFADDGTTATRGEMATGA